MNTFVTFLTISSGVLNRRKTHTGLQTHDERMVTFGRTFKPIQKAFLAPLLENFKVSLSGLMQMNVTNEFPSFLI